MPLQGRHVAHLLVFATFARDDAGMPRRGNTFFSHPPLHSPFFYIFERLIKFLFTKQTVGNFKY